MRSDRVCGMDNGISCAQQSPPCSSFFVPFHCSGIYLQDTGPFVPFICPLLFFEIPDAPFLTQVTMTTQRQCELKSTLLHWRHSSDMKCNCDSYLCLRVDLIGGVNKLSVALVQLSEYQFSYSQFCILLNDLVSYSYSYSHDPLEALVMVLVS